MARRLYSPTEKGRIMRLRLFLGLGAILALTVVGSTALAKAPGGYTCSGGAIPGGTYTGLTVTGNCLFGGEVTVNGNVTVADGALLNDHAFSFAAHVLITGNVKVGKGAVLGLGKYGAPGIKTDTTVGGNIVANQPLSLYLSGITVHGNVISNGGGGGPTGEFRNFPTKDNRVDGNLIIQGWTGGWLGVIRDSVGGNAIVSKNTSVLTEAGPGVDLDSNEVQTNVISGNLICHGNTPAAQVNVLDGGELNAVGGKGIGECTTLTKPLS